MNDDSAHERQIRPNDVGPDREQVVRSAVIVNPVRVEGLDALRSTIEDALREADWPTPAWFETTAEDPGTGQAREAVRQGAEVVFVSGGDGTVRACVEGLAGTGAALAVLPGGTGNILAKNLGLPEDAAEGVRVALERGRRLIDVAEMNGQVFAVMAGMGFDADLMASADPTLKARIGAPAYVLSAFKHLRDEAMRVQVTVDDGAPLRRHARAVIVGNVGRLQGGVPLLAGAEPDDGLLDVAILAPRNLGHWIGLATSVLLRRDRVPAMEVHRGRHVVVRSDRDQACHIDGDPIGPRPRLDIQIRPGALWLCVPQPDDTADLAGGE